MANHPANTIEFSRWLNAASPDEWHQVAQSWNWDNGTHRLLWIVEQPNCDLGTALHIFWLSEPFWNLSHLNPYRPPQGRDRVSIDGETLILEITILKRWVRNDFTRQEIAFDGHPIERVKTQIAPIVSLEVLEAMAQPRAGRKISRGEFDEGIPYEIVEAFNKANGITGV